MSNIFEKALTDVDKLQEDLLGPDYNYSKQIKTPSQLGMSGKGNLKTIANNINGLKSYTEVLVTGKSDAQRTKGPLGNKFFLETGGTCKDKNTGKNVQRSIYISNVPDGSIPFITQGLGGVRLKTFRGLVPGMLSNLNNINPLQILQSFMAGTNPECQMITMETINHENKKKNETGYVTNVDIKGISPCLFSSKKNPLTNEKCKETFQTINLNDNFAMPDDNLINLYYSALGLLGIYLLFKMYEKK